MCLLVCHCCPMCLLFQLFLPAFCRVYVGSFTTTFFHLFCLFRESFCTTTRML